MKVSPERIKELEERERLETEEELHSYNVTTTSKNDRNQTGG
jgi:hypothetical protein